MSLILGVAMAVVLFAGGVAAASWVLQEPAPHQFAHLDERPLWTSRPIVIDPEEQPFERIAAAPVPPVFQAMAVDVPDEERPRVRTAAADIGEPGLDLTTTGAVGSDAIMNLAGSPHAEWCADRYRSYRVEDNTYQPYDGPRRQCDSPYLIQQETVAYSSEIDSPQVEADSTHVSWCLDRYRSYRPSDNTYQPYNGPRRACESPFG
ncbi:hypothetical protein ABID21_001188 [Pseudorhizobium tarimense]|uniref:Lectin-like protein BA14k n=1 Tax=Pseudorhizobium tarimense TaxID=1079109 RepID=A0ABV2H3G5_9HYPH|nr:BA14K family protein [Pseudorhizobium tarimense]MCJ8518490.1 BA14K family protein [Pseudorhizobium tarimense]